MRSCFSNVKQALEYPHESVPSASINHRYNPLFIALLQCFITNTESQTVMWPVTVTCSSGNLLNLSIHFFMSWLKCYNSSLNGAVILRNVESNLLQREFVLTLGEHGRDGWSVWHKGNGKCSSSCVGKIQTSWLQKNEVILATSEFIYFFLNYTVCQSNKANCVCPLSKPIHCCGEETTAISSWQSITFSSSWVIKWCLWFP